MRPSLPVGAILGGALLVLALAWAPVAEAACPNEAIRQQQGATDLPLCMAYELVSPVDQLGANIDFAAGSVDGDHAWLASTTPITADAHTGNISSLAAYRTPDGWRQQDLADAVFPGNNTFQLLARSADSSAVVVNSCPGLLSGCELYSRLERVASDGSRTVMLEAPLVLGTDFPPELAGASADLSHLFIQTAEGAKPLLASDTHATGRGLYRSNEGQLEFIGYDEDGKVLPCGAVLANGIHGTGFEQDGLSADGETFVYSSHLPESSCTGPNQIYVRRGAQTYNISAPRNANPDQGSTYLGNSRDGETVYLLTRSRLLDADTDEFADIYSYDLADDALTRITPGAGVTNAVISPAGDYVYFSALKAIAGQGTDGNVNLFLYHDGSIRYIAAPDGPYVLGGSMQDSSGVSPLTPDGRHLLFLSGAELTGQPLGGTRQIFTYDVEADTFACVSCPPDGSAPSLSVNFPLATPSVNADQRFQSDDGATVVFQTPNQLLPPDHNGTLFDTYLWHAGDLFLISSGNSEAGSQAVGIDAAGHTVFFQASDRLAPEVHNDNNKLYAARVNGGFLLSPMPEPCAGEQCRGPADPPSAPTPIATSTFFGPPDPAPRRHTKKHRAKKRKHKRHHSRRALSTRSSVR